MNRTESFYGNNSKMKFFFSLSSLVLVFLQINAFSFSAPSESGKFVGKALDFQCFTGETTKVLSEKYPQFEIYGVDSERKFVDIACKKYPSFHFGLVKREKTWSQIFNTKFNVIQVSDYENFLETFHNMYDLLEEKKGLLYFHYHENDKDRIEYWLNNFQEENGPFYFHPNIIHHDKKNNFFILLK